MRKSTGHLICLGGVALFAVISTAFGVGVYGLGKPDWAKPYLSRPTPAGPYIAANDHWVVVRAEASFSSTPTGGITVRYRSIYENASSSDRTFMRTVNYDNSQYQMGQIGLWVQRKYLWHSINVKRHALQGTSSSGDKLVVTGAETIPAHHRAVFEYTLTDRWAVLPWETYTLQGPYPIAELHLSVNNKEGTPPLSIRLVVPKGQDLPASFEKGKDGSWTVHNIPAAGHLKDYLAYQATTDNLYPYALAYRKSLPDGQSWKQFEKTMAALWDKREKELDTGQLHRKAIALTKGLSSPYQKACRLAWFVQKEIRYDDQNERGMSAWVPLKTQESLRSMKADCKGKVLLLKGLLQQIGIESEPILLRLSSRYYSWNDRRIGSARLNHVILAVNLPSPARGGEYPGTLTEGPAKGWVLVDVTSDLASLGASLPGYEGFPAIFISPEDQGRFIIHTNTPSRESVNVRMDVEVQPTQAMLCELIAHDNGASPLFADLSEDYDRDSMKDDLTSFLAQIFPSVTLKSFRFHKPSLKKPSDSALSLSFYIPDAIQDLSTRRILSSPVSVAANLAGIANGFSAAVPGDPKDRVTLSSPWNNKTLAHGFTESFDLEVNLTLPPDLDWRPPHTKAVDMPWTSFSASWTLDSKGVWHGKIHLLLKRGQWAPTKRLDCLRQLDGIFTGLYSPLILQKKNT
jgi:hypothetical protein